MGFLPIDKSSIKKMKPRTVACIKVTQTSSQLQLSVKKKCFPVLRCPFAEVSELVREVKLTFDEKVKVWDVNGANNNRKANKS